MDRTNEQEPLKDRDKGPTVKGVVRDAATGSPIAHALVEYYEGVGDCTLDGVESDEEGRWDLQLGSVDPWDYLYVRHEGYAPLERKMGDFSGKAVGENPEVIEADLILQPLGGDTDFLNLVQERIRSGVPLDGTDADGETLLIKAAKQGHLAAIRALLEAGASSDTKKDYDPGIALSNSATPLMYAAQGCHSEAVGLLLEGGADIETTDSFGDTPLLGFLNSTADPCSLPEYLETFGRLVAAGARFDARSGNGNTALHAAAHGANEIVFRYVLEQVPDTEARNEWGETALMCAARAKSSEKVAVLLEAGANPNTRNRLGQTAIYYSIASWLGSGDDKETEIELVRMFLDAGADPGNRDDKFGSLLHWVSGSGDEAILRLLLNAGVDTDMGITRETLVDREPILGLGDFCFLYRDFNMRGWTPLMVASFRGSAKNVEVLLEMGADWRVASSSGETAMKLARRELEKLLSGAPHGVFNDSERAIQAYREVIDLLTRAGAT